MDPCAKAVCSSRTHLCKMDADDLFDDEVTLDWSLQYVVLCLLLTLGEGVASAFEARLGRCLPRCFASCWNRPQHVLTEGQFASL